LQRLFEHVWDYSLFLLDAGGHVRTWGSAAQVLTGYTPDEILGAPMSRFYPPEAIERDLPTRDLQAAVSSGRTDSEGWRVRKDGTRFWADVSLSALHDQGGRLWGFLAIVRDLSERRRKEEQLRQSEEHFRLLVESVRDYAIFTLDPHGYVTSWNIGARNINGYQPQEIIGSHFSRFYPPEATARRWPDHELRVATLEGRFEDEGWRVRKDGTRFWANVVITALRDSRGKLRGFAKVVRDLSERRRQEETLRRSEQRFRLLVEGVKEYALFLVDAQGFVTSWNNGAERIEGYRADEIIGRHVANLYLAQDVAADLPWRDLLSAHSTGRLEREGWRIRKDGSSYRARVIISAMRDEQGELYGYAHLLQDMTQQAHTEALESILNKINEFIAMLAHELRNPLAPIRNAVILMGRKGVGDPLLESMRQTIDRQSLHLERVVDDLLDVNRIARGQLSIERLPVDMCQVVNRAVEASRPLLDSHGHQLHVSLPATAVSIDGDAVRLTQVIMNLLNNAAKYTPRGGQVWLSVVPLEGQVELRVRDTGIGIRPEMINRVFDLFSQDTETLQFTEGGLGVGLALVRRVVELHGGRIDVYSDGRGRGSEFVVSLPRGSAQTEQPAQTPQGVSVQVPKRRILIADDNVDAADSLDMLLQSFGQETHVVHDGIAAVEAIEHEHPDLALLDIGMPKLNGYEVAERVRRSPSATGVKLVAITGWGQEADRQRALQAGFDRHLVKPVSEEALRQLLRD
jgi:PAS domain S-box-containing protein